MFDIGFTELLLVGIVALIVVGPERLPGVIRTGMSYIRQIKSGFAHVKSEVERELELDEFKHQLDESKSDLTHAVGYDELNDSLDELREESEKLRDIAHDGFEYADEHFDVSDAEIEADMAGLVEGPELPAPDSEADTGVEADNAADLPHVEPSSAKKKSKNKAKTDT